MSLTHVMLQYMKQFSYSEQPLTEQLSTHTHCSKRGQQNIAIACFHVTRYSSNRAPSPSLPCHRANNFLDNFIYKPVGWQPLDNFIYKPSGWQFLGYIFKRELVSVSLISYRTAISETAMWCNTLCILYYRPGVKIQPSPHNNQCPYHFLRHPSTSARWATFSNHRIAEWYQQHTHITRGVSNYKHKSDHLLSTKEKDKIESKTETGPASPLSQKNVKCSLSFFLSFWVWSLGLWVQGMNTDSLCLSRSLSSPFSLSPPPLVFPLSFSFYIHHLVPLWGVVTPEVLGETHYGVETNFIVYWYLIWELLSTSSPFRR